MFVPMGDVAAVKRDPRGQGDLGERSAMLWLGGRGCGVFFPAFHSPDIDLVAEWGTGLQRVQVKTSVVFAKQRWEVMVCTRGGNQSWNRVVKRLDSSAYDWLFVLVGDSRRWFIPSAEVGGHERHSPWWPQIRGVGDRGRSAATCVGRIARLTGPRRGTQAVNEVAL
jgi:PD-(D/E)XK endonuclease